MNFNSHITDSSQSLQPLRGSTIDDETVIHFLEVSAQYLNEAVGEPAKSAQRRK